MAPLSWDQIMGVNVDDMEDQADTLYDQIADVSLIKHIIHTVGPP